MVKLAPARLINMYSDIEEPEKRLVIGVFGSGTHPDGNPQLVFPFEMGKWIARNNYHLLTGGGSGVMKAASAGFCSVGDRKGLSIGIIPNGKDPDMYPNPWVELPIFTHLFGLQAKGRESRNHINVMSSDVILVFTGGIGTKAELELAVNDYGKGDNLIVCLEDGGFIYDMNTDSLKQNGIGNFASNMEEAVVKIELLLGKLKSAKSK